VRRETTADLLPRDRGSHERPRLTDELGRTQHGNNNAYCQDNEITWFDWSTVDEDLLRFTKGLISLRRGHPVFRRRRDSTGKEAADLRWFTPSGTEMTAENWADSDARNVTLFIDGSTDPDVGPDGTPMVDDDFLMLINACWEPLTFAVPVNPHAPRWDVVCDTFDPARKVTVAQELTVGPRSIVILQLPSS
jgi:glycogen operon protein